MPIRPLSALAFCLALGAAEPPVTDQTPRPQVPEALRWKVEDLFASPEAWKQELARTSEMASALDVLAKGWTQGPKAMLNFLEALDAVQLRLTKLSNYASFQSDTDMSNPVFQTMKGEVQSLAVNLGAKLAFMESDVLALGSEKFAGFIKVEPKLKPYQVGLERILRQKAHVLPEAQNRVAALTGLFSGAPSKASGLLNNVDLPRTEITLKDGSTAKLGTAAFQRLRASAVREDRVKAMETYFADQQKFENTMAALLDGEIQSHLFQAKIKGFPTCLDAALFPNDIAPAVYKNLIATVRANLKPLHRLLKLRQRMLGLETLTYSDVYAPAVASVAKTYPYDEGCRLVVDAMAPLGEPYQKVLRKAFAERWVDVYPNQGKRSGAYSQGMYGVHPFVLMNYNGSFSEVSTLAHELGHALHSWHSDTTQPMPLADYPIFLAEIASTFNETLLVQHLMKTEQDDRLKLFLLNEYLERIRATLFRQTLFAEFELAMHERVEAGQTLTADWLNAKYLELTRAYYGHDAGVMRVDEYIQSEWSSIPHFYMNYYVFQYATGIIASGALADAVLKEGAPARDRYLTFLKAGGTKFPLDTLKDAGVDLRSPEPIARSLQALDGLVSQMEALALKTGAVK